MKTVTAKDLKNRTGEALRAIGRRERVLITRRGKPYAVLLPVEDVPDEPGDAVERLREEIRADARRHPPPFRRPEEMIAWMRGRPATSLTRGRSSSTSRSPRIRGRR
jgi:prevent-host-death family protein